MRNPHVLQLDSRGEHVVDCSFFLVFNAWNHSLTFTLPAGPWGETWTLILGTSLPYPGVAGWRRDDGGPVFHPGDVVAVDPLSFTLLSLEE